LLEGDDTVTNLLRVPAIVLTLLLPPAIACAVDQQPTAAASGEVVARIGEEAVTESDLAAASGGDVFRLRQELFQARLDALRELLLDRVLEVAAAAEETTPEAVLDARLEGRLQPPDEAQVDAMYQQYKGRLQGDEASGKAQIRAYLEQQARQLAEGEVRDELFEAYDVKILLDPPRADIPVGPTDPSRGPADAPVTLVEFSDFQCPYCGRVQPELGQLTERYGDNLRHVFKQLPLPMHSQARLAAEASLCANDQGKFWPLHDWMFSHRTTLERDAIVAAAGEVGVTEVRFAACLDQGTFAEKVEEDMELARRYGITGTPGFMINGRFLGGAQPIQAFVDLIDDELRRAGIEPPKPEPPAETAPAEQAGAEQRAQPEASPAPEEG
jgi:protein-disulfide isomerase